MPKLLWVALPLLTAAALVVVQVLRRRPPSRQTVNAWSSLLLLAYLLSTAGLGVFWVANQQLPVFDWHYLFGYGTLLLMALHAVFNLPVAWRQVARRRRGVAPAGVRAVPQQRRGALGLLGVLAATGAAFALGLRHGRSDLRIEGRSPDSGGGSADDPGATALALIERFHAFSSHSRAGVLLRAPGVEWGDAPPAFKHHAGARRVALPPPGTSLSTPLGLAALGTALWCTSGVTQVRGRLKLRAAPSSGALFSTELYVVSRTVAGLDGGLWHYDAEAHALEALGGTVSDDAALGAPGDPAASEAAAVVVATAVFRRTGHKYRDRTYRYVLADLGHALENLRAAAAAIGLQARPVAAFDESRVAAALGVDEAEEGVLALVGLHPASAGGPDASRPPLTAPRRWLTPLPAPGAPALGVTAAVHAATSLRVAMPLAAPAPAPASPPGASLPPGSIALPSPPPVRTALTAAPAGAPTATLAPAPGVLRLIAARRSVRRFARTPLALDALADVLAGTTAHAAQRLSGAVRVSVVAHAVDSVPPGAYRHEPAAHALVPRQASAGLRAVARAAALDQDVIGEAAAVFVLSIDRAAFAADPLGPARGWRHAFVEAGCVGERIYLAAAARGLGVCAVGAFYDDEAAALIGVDPAREWVVHFAALGVPADLPGGSAT